MKAIDIILIILMFLCAGLCCWILYLDSLVHDLKGYIARMEYEKNKYV